MAGRPIALAHHRASRGLTQRNLADLAGVSIDTIKRAEAGHRPRLLTQYRIAGALHLDRSEVFPEPAEASA